MINIHSDIAKSQKVICVFLSSRFILSSVFKIFLYAEVYDTCMFLKTGRVKKGYEFEASLDCTVISCPTNQYLITKNMRGKLKKQKEKNYNIISKI